MKNSIYNTLKLAALFAAVSFLLGMGWAILGSKPVSLASPADKLGSIVRLTQNGRTFCSGTVIGAHTVLTAAHCVLLAEPTAMTSPTYRSNIEIRPSDDEPVNVKATVSYVRPQVDQALLRGNFEKFTVRHYISGVKELTILRSTGVFTACGYPLGGPLYCGPFYYKEPDNFFWKGAGVLLPGMSGGPMMDADGNVVATNVAVEQSYSIVAPLYNLDQGVRP